MVSTAKITRVLEAFEFLKPRGDMTISLARTFMAVAEDEGVTGKDLEHRLGMTQGSLSRHLLDLGARNRRFEPGLGLVEFRLAERDYRVKQWFLTTEGRKFRTKLQRIIAASSMEE